MEPVCNLYRIRTYLDEDDVTQGLAIGDVVSVDEDSDFPYCNIHTRGLRYPLRATQLEPLTQQEVNDLFEPQAPKKHEFTYGQRVVIEESQQEYYCLGYTSEGRLITTRKPYDLEHVFTWCKLYSDEAQPYVPPKVKLTVERLNADYGVDAWELSSELGASE